MAAVRNRWKAAVSAARRDEGVADPAIVMITIVVLIVLGLTGLYFGRGFVEQARDANAQSDLSRIAASQEFYASSANAYTDDIEVLQQGRVAFSLSTGVEVRLAANEYGWLASATHVDSGNVFYRASQSSTVYTSPGGSVADLPAPDVDPASGLTWSMVEQLKD